MHQFIRIVLSVAMLLVPAMLMADTKAPYSKPYHKQGRGWYPSIYWSTGRNLGSYYFPNTNGEMFKELGEYEWDSDTNGLIYFYRPDSQWASEELEAPSYYINDEIIFNLRAGSYTYVEIPAGSYDVTARKSLLPLLGFESFDDKLMMAFDLNLLLDVGLEVDPGSVFYIRHSEVSLPKRLHPDLDPDDEMATADVQLVDAELALEEMSKTRYLTHSFWHPSDADKAAELLSGEMQDYGWFSIIWPWSNNFLYGFPLFNLPSDMYRELRGAPSMTLEEELYQLADDKEAYLAAIRDKREPRRNWLAPWRKPSAHLSLNDELILDRLEREALEGNIRPVVSQAEQDAENNKGKAGPWYWPFADDGESAEPEKLATVHEKPMEEARRLRFERIKQTLN